MNKDSLVESEHSFPFSLEEYPLTVREAAKFLGVSVQTVYLWVERKCHMVRATTDRTLQSPVFVQCGAHNYRDWLTG